MTRAVAILALVLVLFFWPAIAFREHRPATPILVQADYPQGDAHPPHQPLPDRAAKLPQMEGQESMIGKIIDRIRKGPACRYRSAEIGKYVSRLYALPHPATTVKERVR